MGIVIKLTWFGPFSDLTTRWPALVISLLSVNRSVNGIWRCISRFYTTLAALFGSAICIPNGDWQCKSPFIVMGLALEPRPKFFVELLTSNKHVFNSETEICDYFLNFQTRASVLHIIELELPFLVVPNEGILFFTFQEICYFRPWLIFS